MFNLTTLSFIWSRVSLHDGQYVVVIFRSATCLSPRGSIFRCYLSVRHVSLTTWVNMSSLSFGLSRVSHHEGQFVVLIFRSVTCLSPRGSISRRYLSVCHESLITWFNMLSSPTPPPPPYRLAKLLQEELETDNDELLYQSARKLLITELQTIVYKEFLPLLLGKRFMSIYKLDIGKGLIYTRSYN